MHNSQSDSGRWESILAYAAITLVVSSIVCFFVIMGASASGVGANDGFSHGLWPVVIMFPWFGLPLAMLLIVTLVVSSAVRRRRDERGGTRA